MDFAEKLALPIVLEMVDRQPGYHGVGWPHVSERNIQIMPAELDQRIAVEPLGGPSQHRLRCVDPNRCRLGMTLVHHRQQAPIASAEIDKPLDPRRESRQQHFLG